MVPLESSTQKVSIKKVLFKKTQSIFQKLPEKSSLKKFLRKLLKQSL